jgi:hypothetical protein
MVAVRESLVPARVMACSGAQSAAAYDLERTEISSTVAEREGGCQEGVRDGYGACLYGYTACCST